MMPAESEGTLAWGRWCTAAPNELLLNARLDNYERVYSNWLKEHKAAKDGKGLWASPPDSWAAIKARLIFSWSNHRASIDRATPMPDDMRQKLVDDGVLKPLTNQTSPEERAVALAEAEGRYPTPPGEDDMTRFTDAQTGAKR